MLLRTGGAVIACTVTDISGVSLPVAIAVATADRRGPGGPGSPGYPAAVRSPWLCGSAGR